MAIAHALRDYLDRAGVDYDLVQHPHADTSRGAAEAAHVPLQKMAKPVLLEDDDGFVLAVVPATHRVKLRVLEQQLGRELALTPEDDLHEIFADCAPGAVPPIGQAYGVDVVVDESLEACDEVYFEAGDHEDLVHVRGLEFSALMRGARFGRIGEAPR